MSRQALRTAEVLENLLIILVKKGVLTRAEATKVLLRKPGVPRILVKSEEAKVLE